MSLAKAIPDGIEDKECKRFAPQERLPVPYILEKDPIQETVSTLKSDQSLKTTIREDSKLCIPLWHCGMHKTFLMHASMAVDEIEKQDTFKVYKEVCEAHAEQRKAIKQAKAALALLATTMSKGKKTSEKSSKKASEKALQKTKEGMAPSDVPALVVHTEYQAD